jgi:transcription antitermination factor NusG
MSNKYWTAFYTKPRNEKSVAERLTRQGYDIYAPLRTTIKQWSDRKKKVQEPLFPSYIFAYVDETLRLEILQDSSIVSSVLWLKNPVKIRDEEIEAIQLFLEEHPGAKAHSAPFKKGQDVQIEEGPFSGKKGVVKEVRNNRIIVRLETLSFELSAAIHPSKLTQKSTGATN